MTVHSVVNVKTNAELIAYVAPLWLPPHLPVVDFTYGRGGWWKMQRPPAGLTGHDAYTGPCRDGLDYTDPEAMARAHAPGSVKIGAFDPPYVSTGGDETSTLLDFNDRYGLHSFTKEAGSRTASTPDTVMAGIVAGLANIYPLLPRFKLERRRVRCSRATGGVRVVDYVPAEGGWVLMKCMDYVSGGAQVDAERRIGNAAETLGYVLLDRFIHHSAARAQPALNPDGTVRRQVHSHRDYSTLLILGRAR